MVVVMSDFEGPTDLTFNRGLGPDEVLARAEADRAPFSGSDELKAWVAQGLDELA
jgi:hypothetical protein